MIKVFALLNAINDSEADRIEVSQMAYVVGDRSLATDGGKVIHEATFIQGCKALDINRTLWAEVLRMAWQDSVLTT